MREIGAPRAADDADSREVMVENRVSIELTVAHDTINNVVDFPLREKLPAFLRSRQRFD